MKEIKVEIGDIIHNNTSGESREVVKINQCGVHLYDGNSRTFIRHKNLNEGIISFELGIIPNE